MSARFLTSLRRVVWPLAALCLLAGVLTPPLSPAAPVPPRVIDNPKAQSLARQKQRKPLAAPRQPLVNPKARLLAERKKRQRLSKGMQQQKQLVAKSSQQEQRVLDELEAVNAELRKERNRLAQLEKELAAVRTALADTVAELANLSQQRAQSREHVKRRLAALYTTGDTGLLNILFSSRSLGELEEDTEYYQRLVRHDRSALAAYGELIDALAAKRSDLERRQAALNGLVSAIRQQEAKLAGIRERQQRLLKRIQTEKRLYLRALQELQAAADRLEERLAALAAPPPAKNQHSSPAATPSPPPKLPDLGFATRKGRLPPPVTGKVVSRFGNRPAGQADTATASDGVDIAAPPGSPVRAVHHGRVVYTGVLRGYGTIVIIDHGERYYTLYSRLEVVYKKRGEGVTAGEIIGMLGEEAGPTGQGLHFEIRHATTPLDPLAWLDPSQL